MRESLQLELKCDPHFNAIISVMFYMKRTLELMEIVMKVIQTLSSCTVHSLLSHTSRIYRVTAIMRVINSSLFKNVTGLFSGMLNILLSSLDTGISTVNKLRG